MIIVEICFDFIGLLSRLGFAKSALFSERDRQTGLHLSHSSTRPGTYRLNLKLLWRIKLNWELPFGAYGHCP